MPGPTPRFTPNFSDAVLAIANALLRQRTAPFYLRQRAQLILLLHEQPKLSNVAAAALVELHPNSVRLWRQRWASGDFSLQDQPGRGRKPSFSPHGQSHRQSTGL